MPGERRIETNGAPDADGVLAAFEDALAGADDPRRTLSEWIARYPALASDLVLTASETALPALGEWDTEAEPGSSDPRGEAVELQKIRDLGADLIARRLSAAAGSALADRCEAMGIGFPGHAAQLLHVPESLIFRLQQAEIDPATIPAAFVLEAAGHLKLTVSDCAALFAAPRRRSYLAVAEERPAYGMSRRPSFAEALAATSDVPSITYWAER